MGNASLSPSSKYSCQRGEHIAPDEDRSITAGYAVLAPALSPHHSDCHQPHEDPPREQHPQEPGISVTGGEEDDQPDDEAEEVDPAPQEPRDQKSGVTPAHRRDRDLLRRPIRTPELGEVAFGKILGDPGELGLCTRLVGTGEAFGELLVVQPPLSEV